MGEWIEYSGHGMPVDGNIMIEIKAVMPGETEERILFPRMAWASMWDTPSVKAYRVVT